jgi:threonine/homoserine/homoserine lactone efflux protein
MDPLILFVLTSGLLIVTPGPDVVYVLTRGIAGGRKAGVISAAGVSLGILVHTLAAAMGLAVLLRASIWAFWALKVSGGLYLLYVAYGLLTKRESIVLEPLRSSFQMRRCLAQGFLSNVLNPKVALFFVTFLPQFVRTGQGSHVLQIFSLGLLFGLMTAAFLCALGFFSGEVGLWLCRKPRFEHGVRIGAGSVLALLGIKMFLPDRK